MISDINAMRYEGTHTRGRVEGPGYGHFQLPTLTSHIVIQRAELSDSFHHRINTSSFSLPSTLQHEISQIRRSGPIIETTCMGIWPATMLLDSPEHAHNSLLVIEDIREEHYNTTWPSERSSWLQKARALDRDVLYICFVSRAHCLPNRAA